MIDRFINARLILFFSGVLAVISTYISLTSGYILAYNDATAHLNTARRVIDSLTPGLVQIGSVWLPLLHLLELPFVANFYLWQSGLAGSIVSGISFIAACLFLYKLITLITQKTFAGFLGVLVFATNLNILYLQSTAMFEPLLIALALGSVYYISKWTLNDDIQDLVKAAFFTMLATLTRYDGWALFLAEGGYVLLYSLLLKRKKSEGILLIFICLAGFGIFLWLLYNLLIFSNPLYFANSEFSAAAQQLILAGRGQLPTKGNLMLSFETYSITTILNIGILPSILMVAGFLIFLKDSILKLPRWAPLLLAVPFVFNIASLYLGQSVIWLPMVPPFFKTFFNARYGILMLPSAAFFAGYLASKNILLKIAVPAFCLAQILLFLNPSVLPLFGYRSGMVTLQDTVSSVNSQTISASTFLHNHYSGGLILVSSASEDAFIFRADLPLKDYITEGTGHYWRQSLYDPRTFATWLVFFKDKSDRVGKAIGNSEIVKDDYKLVYSDITYQIWEKK